MKKMQYARRMLAALIAFVITITNVQPLLASTVIDGEIKNRTSKAVADLFDFFISLFYNRTSKAVADLFDF